MLEAQTLSPQSINTSATKMTHSNGSLSFTVGELVVLSYTDSLSNSMGNGFTSIATITTNVTNVIMPNPDLIKVSVYPNPTNDLVFVEVLSTQLDWFIIDILDAHGKLISKEKYAAMTNRIGINTSKYKAGKYFLSLKDIEGNFLGAYKLIKN